MYTNRNSEKSKQYVEEQNNANAKLGCLFFLIVIPSAYLMISNKGNDPYSNPNLFWIGSAGFFLSYPIILIIGYLIKKFAYSTEKRSVLEQIENTAKQAKEELTTLKEQFPAISPVTYHQGFPGVLDEMPYGALLLKEDSLSFYNDHPYRDTSGQVVFEIAIPKIEKVVYETSESVGFENYLLFGVNAFALKRKTYYLLVDFVLNNNVHNQVVIDTANKKYTEFYNRLITKMNEQKKNLQEVGRGGVLDDIKKLAELRDAGILSEAEFSEKKQILLSKIK